MPSPPDTAATHAQTVREALTYSQARLFTGSPEYKQNREARAALDALVALAEQLRGALDDAHTAAMDFQTHAEQLQQERDEARAYAESQDWHTEWYAPMKARAEAAEAQAEQARAALRQIANLGSPRTALENRDLARVVLADVSAPAGGAKETA